MALWRLDMTQKKVWVILLSRKDHDIQDKDDQKEGSSKKKKKVFKFTFSLLRLIQSSFTHRHA